MTDLSNAEISVEGEYGECLVCGESIHWTQLVRLEFGDFCESHVPGRMVPDDQADMGHDTNLERDTFGDAL